VGIDGRELQGRPTGTGRYLRNLLRAWSAEGRGPLFVYCDGTVPGDPVLALPGITSRAIGNGQQRGLVWAERVLPAAAARDRIDVFFAPAYTCPLSLDAPRVTVVHDVSFFALPHDFAVVDGIRRRATVAASMRASRLVLTVSDFSRREIEGLFPELRGRVRAIAHGADDGLAPAPPRAAARAALGLTGPMILTVGAILNRRPLPVLLRAAASLRAGWPGLAVIVVGENRTHPRLDIPRTIEETGMSGRARIEGYIDDAALASRYAAADVAVFLSDYEGFGLPALESMARGVPVVASRAPALGEIFGEAALLVDPRDEREVAAAVDRVLREPALRDGLVARGRALAARFSWAETAARTWECLESAAVAR
jgi:glycosyltransferase involved in cell wall biosynthesis